MEWFNLFGLIFIIIMIIPNIVFALKCKDGFVNVWENKTVEVLEQIGRFGCLGFMVFNIPGTWYGFPSSEAFTWYLTINSCLIFIYYLAWIICFKKNSTFRALALSIIPSMIFLFSGVISQSILLVVMAVIFAPSHILISYKNCCNG